MDIQFPDDEPSFTGRGIAFSADVDGHTVRNQVATEVLEDFFGAGASQAEYFRAFAEHRNRIRGIAAWMIRSGHRNPDGGADLTTPALERYGAEFLA